MTHIDDPRLTADDVLIAGAGPAGAALALLLARVGLRVRLLDRATFPRTKPCAEYLSPGVVQTLHTLGVGRAVMRQTETRLHGFTLNAYGAATMTGTFGRAAGWGTAPAFGLGVPRTVLDTLLVEQARAAGAEVCEQVQVTDLIAEDGRIVGVTARTAQGTAQFRARIVVGADGVNGVTARRLGVLQARPGLRRFGLVAHMDGIAGLGDYGEMHVLPHGYCGIAPLGDGRANVAMVLHADGPVPLAGRVEAYLAERLAAFPALGLRGENARVAGPILRTGPLAYQTRRLVEDGIVLVGDAGGFYDPFTGQGIFKALRSAQLAAPVIIAALARGDVSRRGLLPYERARRTALRGTLAVEILVQQFLGYPRLFARAIRRLHHEPAMADTLVGVTGDVLPPRRVLNPMFLARLAL